MIFLTVTTLLLPGLHLIIPEDRVFHAFPFGNGMLEFKAVRVPIVPKTDQKSTGTTGNAARIHETEDSMEIQDYLQHQVVSDVPIQSRKRPRTKTKLTVLVRYLASTSHGQIKQRRALARQELRNEETRLSNLVIREKLERDRSTSGNLDSSELLLLQLRETKHVEYSVAERVSTYSLDIGVPYLLENVPEQPVLTVTVAQTLLSVRGETVEQQSFVRDNIESHHFELPISGDLSGELKLPSPPVAIAVGQDYVFVPRQCGLVTVARTSDSNVVLEWKVPFSILGIALYADSVYLTGHPDMGIEVRSQRGELERTISTRATLACSPWAITAFADLLFMTDCEHHCVHVWTTGGSFVRTWGSYGTNKGQFKSPTGIVAAHNMVYVVDEGNHRIQVFGLGGDMRHVWCEEGIEEYQLSKPSAISVHTSNIYVTEINNSRVHVLDALTGDHVFMWGVYGVEPGQFRRPSGIGVDYDGKAWICDRDNRRVQIFKGETE